LTPVVVDASVALKWFVPEVSSAEAARLLDGSFELWAPDLLFPEFGNILWKKIARGEIGRNEARDVAAALRRVPLGVCPSSGLLDAALEIAIAYQRTVYDALYIALAVARGCALVTADARLARALSQGPLARQVRALSNQE
jgi:predicted nucleic acid-binding protein